MTAFVGDPEEVHNHVHMVATARQAQFFRFMDELKPEDLATLIEMLYTVVLSNNGAVVAGKMIGEASAIMRIKHDDACGGCGKRHDQEMLEQSAEELAREREQSDPAFQASLIEYNLKVTDDGKLICAGCGMPYVSLDDRMQRAPGPEGCHGCKHKAAWG